MDLEDIVLRGRNQAQKDKCSVIPLARGPYISQGQKEMEGARGWGGRVGSERLMGTEAQRGKRREFWRRMVEMAGQLCACAERPKLRPSNWL